MKNALEPQKAGHWERGWSLSLERILPFRLFPCDSSQWLPFGRKDGRTEVWTERWIRRGKWREWKEEMILTGWQIKATQHWGKRRCRGKVMEQIEQKEDRQEMIWKEEMGQRYVCLWASAAKRSDTATQPAVSAVKGYMQARQALIEEDEEWGRWWHSSEMFFCLYLLWSLSLTCTKGQVCVHFSYCDAINTRAMEMRPSYNYWMKWVHQFKWTHTTQCMLTVLRCVSLCSVAVNHSSWC